MMPLTIRRMVDSEMLRVPELKSMIGKEVEITIRESELPKPDRWDVLDRVAQLDLLDLDAIRQYDEVEWAAAREACR